MNSKVDIIIPFYNAETTLAEALSSVAAQTCSDWSVIMIDDGSTDSSASIANNFLKTYPGKAKLIPSDIPRSGPALGRNKALRNADSEYVMCLDSDDLLAPFCIEQRKSVMQHKTDLDWAVFNQYQRTPVEKPPYRLFNKPAKTREEAIGYFLRMDTPWQTMAPLWKKEALLKLGGFDETLYPSEDPDIHLRALLDKGLKMKIMHDLPADCYYFVDKGDDKIIAFWRDSIKAKFRFLRKTIAYLPGIVSVQTLKGYNHFMRKGYFDFIKVFLLSRLWEHKEEFKEVSRLLFKAGILSLKDMLLIKFITGIFTSDSLIVKKTRIRGVVKKLFLPEKKFNF